MRMEFVAEDFPSLMTWIQVAYMVHLNKIQNIVNLCVLLLFVFI